MTIEIPGDLEPILKAEAGKAGVDPIDYTKQLLRNSLGVERPDAPSMAANETQLLRDINQSLSMEEMKRYEDLIRRRQEETITPSELNELERLTRALESLRVVRVRSLARLAELRKVPLTQLVAQLEIRPPDVL